jgi:hypothetical protein
LYGKVVVGDFLQESSSDSGKGISKSIKAERVLLELV